VGPETINIPAEGATLWRPVDTETLIPRPGTTTHIGPLLAYMTVLSDQTLSNTWGLTAYYRFRINESASQLQQKHTSTIQIDNDGHLGALLMPRAHPGMAFRPASPTMPRPVCQNKHANPKSHRPQRLQLRRILPEVAKPHNLPATQHRYKTKRHYHNRKRHQHHHST
jgi:hypothetical protein